MASSVFSSEEPPVLSASAPFSASASAQPIASAINSATPPIGTSAAIAASASALPRPIESSAPVSADEQTKCMVSLFPPDTFLKKDPDFAFACDVADAKEGARRVHTALVVLSAGRLTEGMREWSMMGAFQLAAYSALRGRCCSHPGPPTLPESVHPSCDRLSEAAQAISEASHESSSEADQVAAVDRFKKSLMCFGDVRAIDDFSTLANGQDLILLKTLARARGK